MRTRNSRAGRIAAVAAAAVVGALAVPNAAHAEPQGHVQAETGVGYFYGTFGQNPNTTLIVGGTAADFCLDNPEDPFNAEPGLAPLRLFFRNDGSLDMKVNDKNQPIHLYHHQGVGPEWIEGVCAAFDEDPASLPAPFASGHADLKVRVSVITDDLVDVFNSVNGKAVGSDGTEYKVRASADLIVENDEPVGDPADFVKFRITEIRR